MDLKNCSRCGQLFTPITSRNKICRDCQQEEEEDFRKVKEYIYDNFQPTLVETSEETGVSVKRIKKFIREGRLIEMDLSDFKVECKRCEADIVEGDYCKECRNELSEGLKSQSKKKQSEEPQEPKEQEIKQKGRMYTDRRKWRDK
ncbi:flagellar protein [Fuchsiella alkaliacetigena]|uniref:flagellar protein n=1 Tax=Fuchsiella alkaliacetigena TaxID=957042 RepID=UPI00200A1E92|nr:flagellar protein [Fuchsiella alkaliacetigena]MCK8824169.1 flagellar protein [Fuchsiella alkaliacetigena]